MKIYLGMPNYSGNLDAKQFEALYYAAGQGVTQYKSEAMSLLAYGFNRLYCNALNMRKSHGITHFLLLHADVIPQEPKTWVNTLMEEMTRCKADVMSAVIPLKGPTGMTSTALDMASENDTWAVKRYSMKEIMELPETFTHHQLLVNSGCLLIDITKPWSEKVCFTINDVINVKPDGNFVALVESEDWGFSRQAHLLGASIWATRKVIIGHAGTAVYVNNEVWGEDTDPLWEGDILKCGG